MDDGVAGDNRTFAPERQRAAVGIGDDSARFFHYQRAGGVVPGREYELKEQFRPAGGDIAQVDRRRSGSADIERAAVVFIRKLERFFAHFLVVRGGSEDHDAAFERFGRDTDRFSVAEGQTSACSY